jgi:hypothetical protein
VPVHWQAGVAAKDRQEIKLLYARMDNLRDRHQHSTEREREQEVVTCVKSSVFSDDAEKDRWFTLRHEDGRAVKGNGGNNMAILLRFRYSNKTQTKDIVIEPDKSLQGVRAEYTEAQHTEKVLHLRLAKAAKVQAAHDSMLSMLQGRVEEVCSKGCMQEVCSKGRVEDLKAELSLSPQRSQSVPGRGQQDDIRFAPPRGPHPGRPDRAGTRARHRAGKRTVKNWDCSSWLCANSSARCASASKICLTKRRSTPRWYPLTSSYLLQGTHGKRS